MERNPLANPCTPSTLKHAVCQAAIEQLTEAATRDKLEKLKRGAGVRLKEYIVDIKSEDKIVVRIVGGRLGVYGVL